MQKHGSRRRFSRGKKGRVFLWSERSLYVYLILFVGLVGCGAAAAKKPADHGKRAPKERYSKGQYIIGTGCVASTADVADTRLSADELARADVAKQIEVKVVHLVEDFQKEEKNTTGQQITPQMSARRLREPWTLS